MKVSIVLCTYNGSQYLSEQIDSICNQSYTNLEIIINDDASTDDTWQILSGYQKKDARIKLSKNSSNEGFTKNFNKTVQKATGDVIGFSDQDDIWHPDKIKLLIEHWPKESPLIYCNSERFSGNNKDWSKQGNKSYRRFEGTDVRKLAIFNTISGHALLIRRWMVAKVFPVSDGLFYDWYAGFVAGCNGGVSYFPKTLVLQRVHSSNATVEEGYEFRPEGNNQRFKLLVMKHLIAFKALPELKPSYKSFISQLQKLWEQGLSKKFYTPLFVFIAKNQRVLFWNKKKIAGFISRIKHAYWLVKH